MDVPRHRSSEPTPAERGYALGAAERERIGMVAGVYDRLFAVTSGLGPADVRRLGGQALERIAAWSPDLAAEIEGIAAGSGLQLEAVAALNARTELLAAAAGECSTIACLGTATSSGHTLGVQTWDWHEELAGGWLVWTIEHPDGRRTETLTEAGIVGKIGMNDRGVGVLLNILGHRDDGPPIGVPVHAICRRVLDEADGAVQALELLATAETSASSAVTVVADDEDGGICTVELSPAGPGFVTPDRRGVLVHTNHFLADPGKAGDTGIRTGPDSVLRLDQAGRGMDGLEPGEIAADAVLDVMASHRGGPHAICSHPAADAVFGDRWRTLATVVLEPALRDMRVLRGGPCQTEAASTTAAAARQ